jgi:hypothetical protein
MSREDNISQLFIKNEHKLEEAPPSDLWSRIETKLDDGGNVKADSTLPNGKTIAINYKRIAPYFAAAAILLLLIIAFSLYKMESADKKNLAENNPIQDVIVLETEETLPTSESEKVSAFENNDRIQKNRMLETAKKNAGENKKAEKIIAEFGLDRIEINEKSEDLIILTVEPTVDGEKSYIARPKAESNDLFSSNRGTNMSNVVNRNEYQQAGRAYADPPVIAQVDNLDNVTTTSTANIKSNSNMPMIKSKSQKRDNSQRLDGQMQIFEWLLGQWSDKEEEAGKSSEIWRKLNNNSIECIGTKVSGKNKIFEEKLTIYLDKESNRIFLKMPIDDYKKTVVYMMTAHNLDRIVFEQTENQDLPANLILQRNLNGYSVIINSDTKPLKPAQQTYFEQRNRVSDTKVLRILTPSE